MAKSLTTYPAFWSYYLKEHRKPATRALHYFGTAAALACLIFGVAFEPGLLFFIPLAGYSFAWIGHFFVEKNRPATFTYPLWSLVSDFRMFGLWITGRLGPHLKKAGVT
ncbi:MAG: Mpo1-like protein [Rhodospirillaceae bacterium]